MVKVAIKPGVDTVAEDNVVTPFRPVLLGPVDTRRIDAADGSIQLQSAIPLGIYPGRLTERLAHWATETPEQIFLARRGADGAWITLTYAQTLTRVRSLAQALLNRQLSENRTVVILSENSLEHALLGLAAMHVGIPYSAVSPAYSLVSSDFVKLRHIIELMRPGLIYASDGSKYERALAAIAGPHTEIVVAENPPERLPATLFGELLATPATFRVEEAYDRTGPESIAKILFTSGSTGNPKGVITTQHMLCVNQQQALQTFPFLAEAPPVTLCWLPWNHTFGGSLSFGMMLYNGGSFYIDDGRPVPGGIETTIENLRDVATTLYSNVPRGFENLLPYFEADAGLRDHFYSRLQMLHYGGASLPQHVWQRLEELAIKSRGERVVITSGLGCTEASPAALFINWPGSGSGMLGVPVPGLTLKLVPNGDKLEARYRGPNVMPGYWREPELTESAFDEDGFYRSGDALKFIDPIDVNKGFLFDGRIAEDFKLTTGTWVSVGTLRASLVMACAPLIQDAVITGLDQDYIGAILFPNLSACRQASNLPEGAAQADLVAHPEVRQRIQTALNTFAKASTGSASRVERAILATVAPSIDIGEVTDKGSLNQRTVLKTRAAVVQLLYAEAVTTEVMVVSGER